jgi:hypothetical protein
MRGDANLVPEMSREASGSSLQQWWTRAKGPPVSEKGCSSARAICASLNTEPEGERGVHGHAAGVRDEYGPHLSVPLSQFYPSN